MPPFLSDEYRQLAEDLERWDGTVDGARALRERLRGAKNPRGDSQDPREGLLRALTTFYRKCGPRQAPIPAQRVREFLLDPERRVLLRPVFGDPNAGLWPHQIPFSIAEEDARAALSLPTDVDGDAYPRFARIMYAARVRQLWVPAADALAHLALREPGPGRPNRSRELLVREWAALFPAGLPDDWSKGGFGTCKVEGGGKVSHRYRHLLRFAGRWLALGGDPALLGGSTARSFAARSLPRDAADASAVWLCLQALLSARATREEVQDRIVALLPGTKADPQAEAILREIADALPPGHPSIGAIERHLARARWLDCESMEQVDALDSWVETAAWLQRRGRRTRLAVMRGACPRATGVLDLVLDGRIPGESAYAALLARVRRLSDARVFLASPQEERSLLVVEAHRLLDHRDLQKISWERLEAACQSAAMGEGPTGREPGSPLAVRAGIALTIARSAENAPQILLRDIVYPEDVVLSLASVESEKIDIQVAVQAERLLREAPDASARIRFVWKLLQRAPGNKAFAELQDILRRDPLPPEPTGQGGASAGGEARPGPAPLAEVVAAAGTLYQIQTDEGKKAGRGARPVRGEPGWRLRAGAQEGVGPGQPPRARDYIAVFHVMAEHLLGDSTPQAQQARTILAQIEASYGALAAHLETPEGEPGEFVPSEAWIRGVEEWLGMTAEAEAVDLAPTQGAGETEAQGLRSWSNWLEDPFRAPVKEWRSLTQALREVATARLLTREQGHIVRVAVRELRDALGDVRWPERSLFDQQLTALLAWTELRVEAGILEMIEVHGVEEAVRSGQREVVAARALPMVGRLPDDLAVRMHRLLLTREPGVARRVRAAQAVLDRRLAVTMIEDALRDAVEREDLGALEALVAERNPALPEGCLRTAHGALLRLRAEGEARSVREALVGSNTTLAVELFTDAFGHALSDPHPEAGIEGARLLVLGEPDLATPEQRRRVHALLLKAGRAEVAEGLRDELKDRGKDIQPLLDDALQDAVERKNAPGLLKLATRCNPALPDAGVRTAHTALLRFSGEGAAVVRKRLGDTRPVLAAELFADDLGRVLGDGAGRAELDRARRLVLDEPDLATAEQRRRTHAALLGCGLWDAASELRHGLKERRKDTRPLLDDALRDAIVRRDEEAIALLGEQTDPAPSPAVIQAAYAALLNSLSYLGARRISRADGGRTALPAIWSRLRMPAIGAIAGPLLVLDVGSNWDALIPGHRSIEVGLLILAALALSFTALATEVWGQLRRDADSGRLWHLLRVSRRALPTFGAVFAIAAVSAAGVLGTLGDMGAYELLELLLRWLLWSSLSLFLGMFLGLLLQGRRVLDED